MTALQPAVALRPTTLAEARDAVRDAAAPVLLRGAGTKDWGAPVAGASVVTTAGMDRILAHEPADQTATVQAGVPLAVLQAELGAAGQWLAVDPPHAATATVGGVFGTDDHGPARLRRGTLRDLVIGVTMVLADGTVARSGGTVIKNVAGYDLARLCCGALGTLALVAELTVRLHPRPQAVRTLRVAVDAAQAGPLVTGLLAAPEEPAAINVTDDALHVRLEGRADGLDARLAALRGDEVDSGVWPALAEAHGGHADTTVARATHLPDRLGAVVAGLRSAAAAAGVSARVHSHAGLGLTDAVLGPGGDHAAVVTAWRSAVPGAVVVRRRAAGIDDPAVIWGPPPTAIAAMRALKAQFDPDDRLAPGRYVGGI